MHEIAASSRRLRPILWLVALFLIGLGAKLWLIHTYGISLPFLDQWDEARNVYSPFFEGKLKFADLFAAHNEHRIFFTRIYDLTLVCLNGQWDNQVEMVSNALIHVLTLTCLGGLMVRLLGRKYAPLIILPLIGALALPYNWENTMSGFHSQHYFMVVFALPTLWCLGIQPAGSWRWWVGVVTGGAGLFTVGSGFIAGAAVLVLAGGRVGLDRTRWRQEWPTMAVAIVIVGLGVLLRVEVAHHAVLKAHSLRDLLISLGKYLAWPWIVLPPYAVFNLFPVLWLAWLYVRQPVVRTRAAEIILLIGMWTGIQCLAAAYARGANGAHPQWRYMDTTSFILIVNALSLILLGTQHLGLLPLRRYFAKATAMWVTAAATGLALLSYQALRVDIPMRAAQHRMQLLTTRGYLASGNERFLHVRKEYLARYEGNPNKSQDHAGVLIQLINLPHIRALLPACVRSPLPLIPASATARDGFTTNDAFTPTRHLEGEICWSSNDQPFARPLDLESQLISKPRLPYLEFRVTGDLGQTNLSLALVETTGRRTEIKPTGPIGLQWQTVRVKSPATDFRIVARDANYSSWFAFQAPREMGRLSAGAEFLTRAGYVVLFGGLLALAGLFLWRQAG